MKRASLTERIAKIPMAMVVIPFAMGIFFVDAFSIPMWILLLAIIVSLVGAALLSNWWQTLALFILLGSTGALLHTISYRDDVPYNTPLDISLKMATSSASRGGYTSAEAEIVACEDVSLVGRKVAVWGDSLTRFCAGDRINIVKAVRPFRAEREQYARLMHHRGFVGSVSIGRNDLYEYIPTERATLHDWAVARLQSTMEEGDSGAVVLAMTTGEKREIAPELRRSYSASGASHLLAVSGLHIGIAFMLINLLLLPFVLLRHGNIVRSVVAIVLIWLYVWLCGMSPSAVRAAIMFSLLQLSLLSLREYVGINILAGTAFAMLVFDTHLLFDISFQLSFIAVASIVLWSVPLYRRCATRFKVANSIIGVMLVGIVSTIATMPLVAATFSTVSIIGILINPVVILLANVVVLAGVVALTIPPIAVIAEIAAKWQNCVVEWAAALPYGHFEVSLSEGAMWGVYAIFAVVSIVLFLLPPPQKSSKIE